MSRTRLRTPLLGLLVALALPLALPGSASAFQIGMRDDQAFVYVDAPTREVNFDRAQMLGTTWITINVLWHHYAQYGLAPYDDAVNEARSRGMAVHMVLTGNPSYIRGPGASYLSYYRPHIGRFTTFAASVARHFRGRVTYYSIWNEPNLSLYLSPVREAPYIYRRLYVSGRAAIKRADPRAYVLIGELSPSGQALRFLDRASQGLVSDGLAHHPYQLTRVPPGARETWYLGISNVGAIRATLLRLARERRLRTPRGTPLPLYFTEFGYPRPGAYYGYFSEAMSARYSVLAYQLAKRSGARVMAWYQLYRRPGPPQARLWDTGLLSTDGYQWPVFRSLAGARNSLVGP